jgi:DNA polymerase V
MDFCSCVAVGFQIDPTIKPMSQNPQQSKVVELFTPDLSTRFEIPFYSCPITAGFPSPAESFLEGTLDLNTHLIRHPAATFFVRVVGDSMTGAGIFPGDILIVDRSLEPQDKNVVIAVVDSELTVKRLRFFKERLVLVPDNDAYPTIEIHQHQSFEIWGVVTASIHTL